MPESTPPLSGTNAGASDPAAQSPGHKDSAEPPINPKHDRIVWIDCEMTGLDGGTEPGADLLVEIAALVTDSELNILGDGVDIVIGAPDEALDSMNDVVQEMHRSSGLTEEIRASKVTVEEAEKAVLEYVREHVSQPGTAPLAGNSIATDRKFISRDMPALDEFLHYRMIDVSSIKELSRRWYPRIYFGQPDKGMAHRALADIIESIKELRYYRATAFVPQPGPTSEEVAAAAKKITEG
ncbi:MAG TPA: oligoribonuclease [Dietzia timorensis]|uniref:Oligoribonuclease n=1 Tax=Dietzia timorensis TaxID=499555 RepID=A0A921F2X2_9ACTN|nr:oligoribonuclease [Dietzia timorensis]HJE90202.1 oligoribonuclease [Dietzia timorensis]